MISKLTIILLSLCTYLLLTLSYSKNVTYPMIMNLKTPLIINYFSSKTNSCMLPINTEIPYSYLISGDYIKYVNQDNEINYDKTIELYGKKYKSKLIQIQISLTPSFTIIPNFPIFIINLERISMNLKGFSLTPNYDNSSFIFQLKLNDKIDKLQFTIDNYYKIIHFGEYEIPKFYENPFQIKINNTINLWGTTLKRISSTLIKNATLTLNKYAYFNTASSNMFNSCEFYFYLVKKILKEEISTYRCAYYENLASQDVILCNSDVLKKYGNITFEFEEGIINLPLYMFFENRGPGVKTPSNFYCESKVKSVINYLVFGFPFLNLFNFTTFDFENKTIGFYSNDIIAINSNIINQLKERNIIKKLLLQIIIIFLICSITLLYIIKLN